MIYRPPQAQTGSAVRIFSIVIGLVALAVAVLGIQTIWGVGTLRYEVTPTQAIIVFGPKVTTIDRESIVDVSYIESPTRGRRLFGVNMAGLKQGSWSFAETGRLSLYATTTRQLVVIETDKGKWGISPSDPEAFIHALEAGQPGTFEPIAQSAGGGMALIVIMMLAISAFSFILIGWLRRMARTMAYELTEDALVIHGSWRPIRIPYRSIDAVRVETPTGRPMRVVGTALPGLMWGSFSWSSVGRNLRLYTTRLQPLVVIQTGSGTVGLSPEDAQGFANDLKRRIDKD